MFVASLNIDLFFKKVFSNKEIAKKFLESLLGVTITEIKLLSVENKLTDAAVIVKFDFRCKINGKYVVIEMQQKYKVDVVKRFYLYHSVGTALQLEFLKPIKVTKPNGETYTEKKYSDLKPVITVIWMVDDMLGFEEDYIAFTTLPEAAKDFIVNDNLWEQPLENILKERDKTVKILKNDTKGLDFFTQNRIIYVFQRNIVKNKHIYLPYFKYFDFANLSRKKDNTEEDFSKYKDDTEMAEIINRLRKDKLTTEEYKYVSDLYNYELFLARKDEDYKKGLARQKRRLEKNTFDIQLEFQLKLEKAEQEKQKAEQEKQKAEQEKQKAEQEKQKAELSWKINLTKRLLKQDATILYIAELLEFTEEKTKELIDFIEKNKL